MRLSPICVAAVLVAAPAFAADFDQVSPSGNKIAGYVDIYGGGGVVDEIDARFAGVHARANLPVSDAGWNIQFDATADYELHEFNFDPVLELTAHLYHRDPSRYAVGAFGSAGSVGVLNFWGGGIEGQYFIDRFTLYGQAGARTTDILGQLTMNEYYVRGVARYFPTDNVKLEAEIGYSRFDDFFAFSIFDVDRLFWSASLEFRPSGTPLAVYAKYSGSDYDLAGQPFSKYAVMGGVRLHLGSDSLLDNDRRGASLDTHIADTTIYGLAEWIISP